MSKKIAIVQSNYIPWKGYFDLMNSVDEFVFLDDVQYTKRDWRNRNKIKTRQGVLWITIPVHSSRNEKIKEIKTSDSFWKKKHWNALKLNYSKCRYFVDYKDFFEELFLKNSDRYLSDINTHFITAINSLLAIKTEIKYSSDFNLINGKTERLINLCQQLNATEYLSGPAAKNYIDESLFTQNDIKLTWMDYSNYLEYQQPYPPFVHEVTIIDLIFNEGPNSKNFMKSFTL